MKEEAQLLAELARLIERYGVKRFERLASTLRNPEDARNLAATVEAALEARSGSKKPKGEATRTPAGSRILEALREQEPEKYEVLASFRDAIVAHQILPSIRHMRRFADENGITLGSTTSREKAITPLLRFMAALPLAGMEAVVQRSASEDESDRSLARWSEVIMGRGSKQPPSEIRLEGTNSEDQRRR